MNQREAFEKWWEDHGLQDDGEDSQYSVAAYSWAKRAWQAATANQWQTIETAPKDGTDVVVYLANNRPPIVAGYFKETNEWLAYDEPMNPVFPTHWMPLPPAP